MVAAQREYAQELLGGGRQCCQVWGFSPRFKEFHGSYGEFQFESGEFWLLSCNIQRILEPPPGNAGGRTTCMHLDVLRLPLRRWAAKCSLFCI